MKRSEEWTKEDFISIFEESGSLIRSYFYNQRQALREHILTQQQLDNPEKMLEILDSISYADVGADSLIQKSYFGTIEHLKAALDLSIDSITNFGDPGQFLAVKVACYLAWAGITVEQAVETLISNVTHAGRVIEMNGNIYEFPASVSSDIALLQHLESFSPTKDMKTKSGKQVYITRNLKEGDHLLRTSLSSQMTPGGLYRKISELNTPEGSLPHGKKFNYQSICDSLPHLD